jgi:amidase
MSYADTGPEDFKHAPLAIQLVGMRQEDESLTEIAAAVDRILNT